MRPHRNRALFSNYYLDELLPKEEEFNIPISEIKTVFEKVKGTWDKSTFEAINEASLRKHFLDKVLDYLGWIVAVEAPIPTGEWSKRPDYALFQNPESLKSAQKGKENDYFKRVTCVAEAKRWGQPLDKKLKTETDPVEIQNPSLQISRYLWLTGVKWGILTDGKYWRLYERETSKRLDIFYEINLEDLIESGSSEDFRYFYLLFRKDAFPEFIEKVYKGSIDYAEKVGEELKDNIYQALTILAQGFLKTPGNDLSENHLKEIHDNSLILLYRLLFILYAEHRDLLPLGENKLYTDSYSLDAFKKEIADRFDKNEPIAASTFGYWNKLKELFEIINRGNKELGVPPYNGGLFDPEKHNFLENHRVSDLYVAKSIDLLSRSKDKAYIDYGSLEIRHLGSIYEGLLEYKLKIADQDLVPIKDKGKELFVSLTEAKKQKKTIRDDEKILAGEIYLVTDKGERKATGSYYTPDYVVKYIVENTVGPLIEEKRKKISEKIEELKKKIKGSRGASREFYEKELRKAEGSLIDEILSLRVLDPAMGSGHFLVEATDFLARELLKALSGEPLEEHTKETLIRESSEHYGSKKPEEEDIRWARREVVERCIFGVDLNPMAVELSKLSLWLYTVAKGKPLNFLDHHLKCGNSLIGAKVEDLHHIPGKKKKTKDTALALSLPMEFPALTVDLGLAVGDYLLIEQIASEDVKDIKKKTELYQNLNKERIDRWRDIANIWISSFFGVKIDQKLYKAFSDYILGKEERIPKEWVEEYLNKALNLAKEKNFFHWELEFPEVFYDHHGKSLTNPGFNAIVGNPPYIQIAMDNNLAAELKPYLLSRYLSSMGRLNTFGFFTRLGIEVLRIGGILGFIVPNTMLTMPYYKELRAFLLENTAIKHILLLDELPFDEAVVENIVFLVQKEVDPALRQQNEVSIECPHTIISSDKTKTHKLIQSILAQTEMFVFAVNINQALQGLQNRLKSISDSLGLLVHINQAIALKHDRAAYLFDRPLDSNFKKLLDGRDIDRYSLEFSGVYLKYDVSAIHSCKRQDIFLTPEKLFFRRVGVSIVACYDDNQHYALNTLVVINQKRIDTSLRFILTLLNSSLLNWYFVTFLKSTKDVFSEIQARQIAQLPICRIAFITPQVERKRLIVQARNHCMKYLETGKPDTILYFVQSRLTKEHKPDKELVKRHNSDPLNKDWQIPEGILWEQSDVVHDTLAFLAEQMIEMNKEKRREIKGYLKWFESQLKIQSDTEGHSGIEALTGKTQIKDYLGDYQKGEEHLPFDDFWKVFEKSKAKIQANLKSRELYENIRSEYEKSLSKLLPLKEKLHKTDWLIDQIVYKLYGLTEEEIKVVEQEMHTPEG